MTTDALLQNILTLTQEMLDIVKEEAAAGNEDAAAASLHLFQESIAGVQEKGRAAGIAVMEELSADDLERISDKFRAAERGFVDRLLKIIRGSDEESEEEDE